MRAACAELIFISPEITLFECEITGINWFRHPIRPILSLSKMEEFRISAISSKEII
jgi:hypothetical protein